MQSQYFTISGLTAISQVPQGGRIHVIGVSGVAMAQLAIVLTERGYEVSGSDKEFYEPMGSLLRNSPVKLCQGYSALHVPDKVDLVVVGNAVLATNEEVRAVENRKLPYTIFPKLLFELVISGKQSIVVSGTHGKSTTSAMIAALFVELGRSPGYFVGGVARDLPKSLDLGQGKVSVVEGDEYDSAFFAKVPKFSFYQPNILVITSVEFDHADIYSNLESINQEFDAIVRGRSENDIVIVCVDEPNLRSLAVKWQHPTFWNGRRQPRILTYGSSQDAEVRLVDSIPFQGGQKARVLVMGRENVLSLKVPGEYNAKNALAALLVGNALGEDLDLCVEALSQFQGVKRRQEVRFEGAISLIEDFAHHPTAVRETVSAIKASYPTKRLWAVFEPRSNTSRKKIFQQQYVQAFAAANRVVLCEVAPKSIDSAQDLLDVKQLATNIDQSGVSCIALPSAEAIFDFLKEQLQEGDLVLVMSNGSFGGLIGRLELFLQR